MALLITFTCQFYYSIIFQQLPDTGHSVDLSLVNRRQWYCALRTCWHAIHTATHPSIDGAGRGRCSTLV